ncbi:MAG TPA: HlyD family efflux transporter periplasmic adaptor subunit [Terriglobales bacterium]|nr:HlyD family efflux transporter periplasmic adaptor subunit [Terriglobales bacterium]
MDKVRDPKFLKKRRMRRIGMGVIAVLALAGVSFAVARLKPAPPTVDGGSVWGEPVKQGTMVRQVHGLGTLVPEEVRTIPATTEGRVEAIPVLPGTPVKPGTLLVQLTNPATEKNLSDAEAQLKSAEADLANLKATLHTAFLAQQSTQANLVANSKQADDLAKSDATLLTKGLVPRLDAQSDADKAAALRQQVTMGEGQLESMQASDAAQIASGQAKVDQMQAGVNLAKSQVDALTVRSGIDGLLEDLDMGGGTELQVGQWVPAGTAVAKVVQPTKLKAQIKIAETDVRDVTIGLPASVDTHNGIVPGHVMRIDPNSQNGTVSVDVALDGPLPPGSRPDLSVDGTVNLQTLKDVVYVGRPAFGTPNSTVTMFKISPDGRDGTRVKVALGAASVNTIQILQGLNVGDWVVLSDTSAQDAFDRIRFSPPVAVH